jgi:hypothetical protein
MSDDFAYLLILTAYPKINNMRSETKSEEV